MILHPFAAFGCAFLFGCGLALSGMTDPTKVQGFLNVFHQFDPTLLFVMASAVATHAILFRLIMKKKAPIFAPAFQVPARSKINARLVIGAAIFGVGWGMSGICPGPAIVSLSMFSSESLLFVVSMFLGMGIYGIDFSRVRNFITARFSPIQDPGQR